MVIATDYSNPCSGLVNDSLTGILNSRKVLVECCYLLDSLVQ